MVIGFDVFRDKLRRKKNVGAFVASLNETFSAWYSTTNFHRTNEEISSQLYNNVSGEGRVLVTFSRLTDCLPPSGLSNLSGSQWQVPFARGPLPRRHL